MPTILCQVASNGPGFIPFVVIAVIILLVVAGAIVARRYEIKRLAALQHAADRLGWRFEPTGEWILSSPFADFPLLTAGGKDHACGTATAVISSADGHLVVFEYCYTTGAGKSRSTHRQTVAAVRIDGDRRRRSIRPNGLPRFRLCPEDAFHRLAQVFGYQDIDFDDWPEFSRRWLLRGEDESAIRAFFDGRRIEALQNESPVTIEAGGEWVLIYRFRTREKPERIAEFIEHAERVARILA